MAIYHLSIKIFSRGKGASAVMKAAYRAGEKITSEYDGLTHDYTRKGGVAHTDSALYPFPILLDVQCVCNSGSRSQRARHI